MNAAKSNLPPQQTVPKQPWIATYTGRRLSLLDPCYDQICLEDIARGLSHQPRFVGQTEIFWSVAGHSLLCHNAYLHWCTANNVPVSEDIRCGLLLHDAHEAYLGDDSRPKKQLCNAAYFYQTQEAQEKPVECIDAYALSYARLKDIIYDKYNVNLNEDEEAVIKGIDNGVLFCEAKAIQPNSNLDEWQKYPNTIDICLASLTFRIQEYRPSQIRELYLATLHKYIGE